MRAVSLGAIMCGVAIAQCTTPPEISSLNLEQTRSRIVAGGADFQLYKRLLDLTPTRPRPGIFAPELKKLRDAHPDDARFLYLYGRALIGKNTAAAIGYLRRAVAIDSKLPWTYTALAEVYASPNFKDEQNLLTGMREFRKLCPGSLEGFRYLDHFKDARVAGDWAAQLRPLLERQPEDGRYWRLLWGAEFRAAPESEYPKLRKRVGMDVRRLESLPNRDSKTVRLALWDGYQLTGQAEAAAKIDESLDDQDAPVLKELMAWESRHGLRTRNDITREEHEAIWREEAGLAAEWVRKWPSSHLAWSSRLSTLPLTPNWTKDELERVGMRVLELDRQRDLGLTDITEGLRVARVWIRYGVRLKESLRMAEDALAEIALGPEEVSDLTARPDSIRSVNSNRFGFDASTWDAMNAIIDASVQLNDLAKARWMLGRMQQWLDTNSDRRSASFQRVHLTYAAKVAEAEGRKLDAIAFYAKAMSSGRIEDRDADHARDLWREQGGSKESWDLLTTRPEPRPVRAATAAAPPLAVDAFQNINRPLSELKLRDVAGNTWTLDKLKGKRTFVNVWATWCGPCRQEFPSLQKLYELTKGRDDVQVITLNVDDENPGMVAPFLSANGATLPVIIGARPYVMDFIGMLGIPQNWLVDRTGTLRQKSHGFDDSLADWPARMLERLQQLP